MAQNTYDECEDHYLQMKMQGDDEGAAIYTDAIEKLCGRNASSLSDAEIQRLTDDIRQRVKVSNSAYLKKKFPQLFTQ